MRKYIIVAPPLSKSQGVKALYHLHDVLRARGYEAFIFCPEAHVDKYYYIDELDERTRINDIVVYPEVVQGNPLRFQNVVRYVLYYPGALGGAKSYHPSEAVFTWAQVYLPCPNELCLSCIDDIFYDEKLPKTQDCYFIHKGGKWKNIKEVENLLEINMHFPSDRNELAQIFKATGTLYCFDAHSAIMAEAAACGAKVKIVTKDGFKDFIYTPPSSGEEVEFQIDNFVEVTQKMTYVGPLEPYPLNFDAKLKIYKQLFLLAVLKAVYFVCKNKRLGKRIFYYTSRLKRKGKLGVLAGRPRVTRPV